MKMIMDGDENRGRDRMAMKYSDRQSYRRVLTGLLTGMVMAAAAGTVMASSDDSLAAGGSGAGAASMANVVIPQEIQEIPDTYFDESGQPGTLQELAYDTWESFSYEEKTTPLTKHAIVYLPYGYDEDRQYDIFYLMHGGWSDYTTTLGTTDEPSAFKNVMDNAIEAGDIEPVIIVCPTYNNTNENGLDSNSFSLAMQLTDQFHNELRDAGPDCGNALCQWL